MTKTIAVAGKGGVGKTTIAALLIDLLSKKGTVLAIDADPSSNLNLALGLPLSETIGGVREDMLKAVKSRTMPVGIAKLDYLDLKVHEAIVESPKIDLLAMGRPEGPGCYCAANNMLRDIIDKLENNYDYIVVDNEAGMEHISRQTTRDVDVLLLVSDPSLRGVLTANRMKELIKELRTTVAKIGLVINRTPDGLPPEIDKAIKDTGLEVWKVLPFDRAIFDMEVKGKPLVELPADSPVKLGVQEIAQKLGLT